MSTSSATIDLTQFDVRVIPCRQKHVMIFQRWSELPIGSFFVLINDHDPVPLYYQFAAQFAGAFTWEYLLAGPDEFQVKISRVAANPTAATAPLPPKPAAAPAPACTQLTINIDACGLEPPEPMMRILAAVESLSAGVSLRARTDRRPLHLYPELDARSIRYTSEEQANGSWITILNRA